jgi:hypothetical protein
MSQANVEVAKRWVDAFNGRDVESFAALATPDFCQGRSKGHPLSPVEKSPPF